MLTNLKKRILAIVLGATVSIPTTAVFTGIAPIQIGSISNQQPASAGCGYSNTQWAWWGTYTYLNKCAAYEMSDRFYREAAYAGNGAITPNPYVATWAGAQMINKSAVSWALRRCANNAGQAYLKYPYSFAGQAAEVTCY